MHGRFIESAANANEIKQKVTELRQTVFTNSNISAKLTSYGDLISDDITNQPDDVWSRYWQPTQIERTTAYNAELDKIVANVESNYDNFLKYYDNPMPFYVNFVQQSSGLFQAGWEESVTFSGGSMSYDLIISKTIDFKVADIVRTFTGLTGTTINQQLNLPSGTYFVKMLSRDSTNPQVKWQAASNTFGVYATGGFLLYNHFGVVEMNVQ